MNFNDRVAFNQRKLDHYNKWLLDPAREMGTVYPGFPEELELIQSAQKRAKRIAKDVIVEAKATAKAKAAPKAKRARRGDGPTKQERAVELYKANIGLSKDNMIEVLRTELQMSLAGATTYYYNAKRLA